MGEENWKKSWRKEKNRVQTDRTRSLLTSLEVLTLKRRGGGDTMLLLLHSVAVCDSQTRMQQWIHTVTVHCSLQEHTSKNREENDISPFPRELSFRH